MIRVLIVDDQDLVRVGLRTLIDSAEDIEVVGEADTGISALATARETKPDVVLMDIRMPGMDGLEATRRIVDDDDISETRVIVLTTFEHDEYVFEALEIGASGFLLKNTPPDDLLSAIKTVHDGGSLLSPSVTTTVIRELTERKVHSHDPHPMLDTLTSREREVVGLVGHGMSNDEIAEKLYISPATARTHVSRAMTKLHARDRAQLVVFAYRSGLT